MAHENDSNKYHYDGILYAKNHKCSTCGIIKGTSSIALRNQCVLIADHHCIWLNQCVGKNNRIYFLIFLLYHLIFFSYATWLIAMILYYKGNVLQNKIFYNKVTKKEFQSTTHYNSFSINKHIGIFVVGCITCIMIIALFFF